MFWDRSIKKVYEKVAKDCNVDTDEMTSEMQKGIDEAWSNPDPSVRAKWDRLFPNGKPTIEEFICVTSNEVRNKSL